MIASQAAEPPRIAFNNNNYTEQNILTIDDLRLSQEGLPLQLYDAFVIFADEDIDFATEMINEMEARNLKVFKKKMIFNNKFNNLVFFLFFVIAMC